MKQPSTYDRDLTVKVYQNRAEVQRNEQDRPTNEVSVTPGMKVMGYQFSELEMSPLARQELARAVHLVSWYTEALLCRFEPDTDVTELRQLLGRLEDS